MSGGKLEAMVNRGAPDTKVDLPGLYNARELGGLPLVGGGQTARGVFLRSADLRFAPSGTLWALRERGFTTVLDLRNDFERIDQPRSEHEERMNANRIPPAPEAALPPGMIAVHEPLDAAGDPAFFARLRAEGKLGSPRFFRPVLAGQPDRPRAAVRALLAARKGVLFHCAIGRDRTGLVAFLLLSLAGVEQEAIVADYLASRAGLTPFFARLGFPDPSPRIEAVLAEHGYTIETAMEEALDGWDPAAYLVSIGFGTDEVASLRARLRGD